MPLYLVRWPGPTATLIRARSETHLADIIDEVGSPGDCTWSLYRGPLMIDFEVPVQYEIRGNTPERPSPEDVEVEAPTAHVALRVSESTDSETAWRMKRKIVRQAFPKLTRALYEYEGEETDPEAVRRAVAADVAGQAVQRQRVGVTFGDEMELLRTRRHVFRRFGSGRFKEVDVTKADDFCCGRGRLRPDAEGLVHLASVDIAHRDGEPISAMLSIALRLRARLDGTIVTPHRTDAFPRPNGERSKMHERRNDAVAWSLSPKDLTTLSVAVNKVAGYEVPLSVSPFLERQPE
jgi:hypothetical protein